MGEINQTLVIFKAEATGFANEWGVGSERSHKRLGAVSPSTWKSAVEKGKRA